LTFASITFFSTYESWHSYAPLLVYCNITFFVNILGSVCS